MGKKSKKKPAVPALVTGPAAEPYLNFLPGGSVAIAGAGAGAGSAAPHAPVLNFAPIQDEPKRKKKPDTAGAMWGHMPAPKLTAELKRDLMIVKMRGALDPKRFYRAADKELPKYFQMGTVMEGADDGVHRLTKRERKGTMLGELMADDKIRKRAKSQFLKAQAAASDGVKKSRKPQRKPKLRGGGRK